MRKQKSGHIFQVSSVGGRHAVPGNTPYHAAKWAVSATRWRWLRSKGLHTGAGRYSDQLGTARHCCARYYTNLTNVLPIGDTAMTLR
jgi:hypothetical protein